MGDDILEYGAQNGRWGGCMSTGCVQIWATQFGYRAGVRRGRDDLVEIGVMPPATPDTTGPLFDGVESVVSGGFCGETVLAAPSSASGQTSPERG